VLERDIPVEDPADIDEGHEAQTSEGDLDHEMQFEGELTRGTESDVMLGLAVGRGIMVIRSMHRNVTLLTRGPGWDLDAFGGWAPASCSGRRRRGLGGPPRTRQRLDFLPVGRESLFIAPVAREVRTVPMVTSKESTMPHRLAVSHAAISNVIRVDLSSRHQAKEHQ
jgi:hypothetical protein